MTSKILVFTVIVGMSFAMKAKAVPSKDMPVWMDPEVNEVNRLTAHNDFTNKNELRLSLHGMWNFECKNFPEVKQMPIPGMWELNGVGEPMYCGVGYEWKTWWTSMPPQLPDSMNYIGTYSRLWMVPKEWKNKDVILHIGSVTSCVSIWVNGHYVGYGEDSKLEQEFDVTRFLKFGKDNEVRMEVRRWCDGSYLEDQDFFRFKGFARDTYLAARPKNRIVDVKVETVLNNDFTEGNIVLDVKTKGKVKWQAMMDGKNTLTVSQPRLWSAESPFLYKLHIISDVGDDITMDVGFRRIEIRNAQLLVNGQPVLIKGVNRHELDPNSGYVVSRERMEEDVKLMKRWNINALRMSHYPNDPYMYELCDRYGIYVVSETNIETHGMGFKEKTLAMNSLFKKVHMERNQRHVAARRNHPSVIIWSMGNECGYGENFEQVYDWLKVEDTTRPIQFEQAYDIQRATDIYCPMYPPYNRCVNYNENSDKDKPMIMCEYAHAMGNSLGEFSKYWEMIRRYPKFQGGFIWDFADQAVLCNGTYLYDGDWNSTRTGDINFCVNGIFGPDRQPNPQAFEVRYFYQNIWTELDSVNHISSSMDGKTSGVLLVVHNENFFRDLSNYRLEWTLMCDGETVKTGVVDNLDVKPQHMAQISLNDVNTDGEGEWILNVSYVLKETEGTLKAGHEDAYQQFVLKSSDNHFRPKGNHQSLMAFNHQTGFLNSFVVNGKQMILKGSDIRPNFWRAPTDNDFGASLHKKYRPWKNPKMILDAFDSTMVDGHIIVTALYKMPEVNCRLKMTYNLAPEGWLAISETMTTDSINKAPNMFRYGITLTMPREFDNLEYYGRGPWENYSNRKEAALIGIYRQTVDEQFHPYVRVQETGTKTDVRWWKVISNNGCGMEFSAEHPFSASALHYTISQLDAGEDKGNIHPANIEKQPFTQVCIDMLQMGMVCIDSWSAVPSTEYQIPCVDRQFTVFLNPTGF